MIKLYNNTLKYILLFFIGGYAYCGIEILFRGFSHISMLIAGGLSFVLIGLLNENFNHKMALVSQMVLSACIITAVEFLVGLVVNVKFGIILICHITLWAKFAYYMLTSGFSYHWQVSVWMII